MTWPFLFGEFNERIPLPGGELVLFRQALSANLSQEFFQRLRQEINWSQDVIKVAGRSVKIPRLQAWYGDASYTYSGLKMQPLPWTELLLELKATVEKLSAASFNSVLLNLYRDGGGGMGWHSDDEAELGSEPVIASLSLGATRDFCLREKKQRSQRLKLELGSGDLLIMAGQLQVNWQHQVPKTRRAVGERINLTFRHVREN